jgi:hypothetical protein
MRPAWVQWPILLVFFLCACCPVNRLKGRSRPVKTVIYEAIVLEKPTVRFIGHRSLKIRQGVPTGTSGHIEAELEEALANFGGVDFTALVLEQAAGQLGWTQAKDGAGADAVMQIRVENICFCAPDGLSEVEVKLALKVVLTESGSGDVLWRDCLDWAFEGLYSSLQDLAQADAAQQKELFSDLAARLLDRLAKHLATQVPKG